MPNFAITSAHEPPCAVAERLAGEGTYVWHGHNYAVEAARRYRVEPHGWVLVGFVYYNTLDEVERVLAALG